MFLITMLLAASAAGRTAAPSSPTPDGRFVVHEWGTFTAVAGEDGSHLDWLPLSGPSDLPDFVYTVEDLDPDAWRETACRSKSCTGTVRMETPVLYFHAPEEMVVEVSVRYPSGTITEWYPRARAEGLLSWGQVRVLPGATPRLPHDGSASHYYPARETSAAALKVCSDKGDQWEKVLFYRGVGQDPLPLRVSVSERGVHVEDTDWHPGQRLILFEHLNGRVGVEVHELHEPRAWLDRPAAGTVAGTQELLGAELRRAGLYDDEIEAMLATWEDSWFEPGLRVFWVLPQEQVEAMLPLTLSPAPDELKRAMVGRLELMAPEMEAEVLRELGSPRPDQAVAETLVQRWGRFAQPLLRGLDHPRAEVILALAEASLVAP
jgi:hypothetical protein